MLSEGILEGLDTVVGECVLHHSLGGVEHTR